MQNLGYMSIPSQYAPYYPQTHQYFSTFYKVSSAATMIVLISSIILGFWLIFIIVFNVEAILSLMIHPSWSVLLFLVYYVTNTAGMLYTTIMGLVVGIRGTSPFNSYQIFIPYVLNLVLYSIFVSWTWKKFLMGINMTFLCGMIIQAIVVVSIKCVASTTQRYKYMMIPKY